MRKSFSQVKFSFNLFKKLFTFNSLDLYVPLNKHKRGYEKNTSVPTYIKNVLKIYLVNYDDSAKYIREM